MSSFHDLPFPSFLEQDSKSMLLTTASSAHVPVATFCSRISLSYFSPRFCRPFTLPPQVTVHLCTRTDLHHDESTVFHWFKDHPETRTSTHLNTHTHISTVSPKSIASNILPAVSFGSSSTLSRVAQQYTVFRTSKVKVRFFFLSALPASF